MICIQMNKEACTYFELTVEIHDAINKQLFIARIRAVWES